MNPNNISGSSYNKGKSTTQSSSSQSSSSKQVNKLNEHQVEQAPASPVKKVFGIGPLFQGILSFLNPKDVRTMRQVSQSFKAETEDYQQSPEGQLRHARALEKQGKLAEAVAIYAKYADSYPPARERLETFLVIAYALNHERMHLSPSEARKDINALSISERGKLAFKIAEELASTKYAQEGIVSGLLAYGAAPIEPKKDRSFVMEEGLALLIPCLRRAGADQSAQDLEIYAQSGGLHSFEALVGTAIPDKDCHVKHIEESINRIIEAIQKPESSISSNAMVSLLKGLEAAVKNDALPKETRLMIVEKIQYIATMSPKPKGVTGAIAHALRACIRSLVVDKADKDPLVDALAKLARDADSDYGVIAAVLSECIDTGDGLVLPKHRDALLDALIELSGPAFGGYAYSEVAASDVTHIIKAFGLCLSSGVIGSEKKDSLMVALKTLTDNICSSWKEGLYPALSNQATEITLILFQLLREQGGLSADIRGDLKNSFANMFKRLHDKPQVWEMAWSLVSSGKMDESFYLSIGGSDAVTARIEALKNKLLNGNENVVLSLENNKHPKEALDNLLELMTLSRLVKDKDSMEWCRASLRAFYASVDLETMNDQEQSEFVDEMLKLLTSKNTPESLISDFPNFHSSLKKAIADRLPSMLKERFDRVEFPSAKVMQIFGQACQSGQFNESQIKDFLQSMYVAFLFRVNGMNLTEGYKVWGNLTLEERKDLLAYTKGVLQLLSLTPFTGEMRDAAARVLDEAFKVIPFPEAKAEVLRLLNGAYASLDSPAKQKRFLEFFGDMITWGSFGRSIRESTAAITGLQRISPKLGTINTFLLNVATSTKDPSVLAEVIKAMDLTNPEPLSILERVPIIGDAYSAFFSDANAVVSSDDVIEPIDEDIAAKLLDIDILAWEAAGGGRYIVQGLEAVGDYLDIAPRSAERNQLEARYVAFAHRIMEDNRYSQKVREAAATVLNDVATVTDNLDVMQGQKYLDK